jgi:hypothetical protein
MPVDGLHRIGAGTWPGAGANPASGTRLARQRLDHGE